MMSSTSKCSERSSALHAGCSRTIRQPVRRLSLQYILVNTIINPTWSTGLKEWWGTGYVNGGVQEGITFFADPRNETFEVGSSDCWFEMKLGSLLRPVTMANIPLSTFFKLTLGWCIPLLLLWGYTELQVSSLESYPSPSTANSSS